MSQTILTLHTPGETAEALAARAKALRLHSGLTRKTLAVRAGVNVASLIRFETTGKSSLSLVLKIAHALNRLDEFDTLLQPPPARTIDELEARTATPPPKRGRL
jgi:transcriptional regulator with XRE-family HTH domain